MTYDKYFIKCLVFIRWNVVSLKWDIYLLTLVSLCNISSRFIYWAMYIHLVLSIYLLYILISGNNMHEGPIFLIIFVNNEIFKILFTKIKFIKYYYFINIYIFYWNRAFILMKFLFFNFSVIKFYDFFYLFLYMVLIF